MALLRRREIKNPRDDPEDDIRHPHGQQGRHVAEGGKNGENLHEQDVDKGQGQTEAEVEADAAAHLAAGVRNNSWSSPPRYLR